MKEKRPDVYIIGHTGMFEAVLKNLREDGKRAEARELSEAHEKALGKCDRYYLGRPEIKDLLNIFREVLGRKQKV